MEFDKAFLLKLKKGNKKAFESLFLSTYESLCEFSFIVLKSKEDAEGAVQDVFANVWQTRSELDVSMNIKSYLYRSVKNRSLDICKHKDVREKYQEQIKQLYQSAQPGDTESTVRLIRKVRAEVENLPEDAKMVYLLHRRDGLTYKEIAQVLDISVKTVESRMTKALKQLRSKLEHEVDLKMLPLLAIFLP